MYFLYLLFIQIDREKYLLLAYDQHCRTITGSGIFDHYNNPTDITGISTEYLTTQSYKNSSLLMEEMVCDLSELESKQKSDCQVKSVFRPPSYEVSLLWCTKLLEYLIKQLY